MDTPDAPAAQPAGGEKAAHPEAGETPAPALTEAAQALIRRWWDDRMPGSIVHREADLYAYAEAWLPRLRQALAAEPDGAAAVEASFDAHFRESPVSRRTPVYNHLRRAADDLKALLARPAA